MWQRSHNHFLQKYDIATTSATDNLLALRLLTVREKRESIDDQTERPLDPKQQYAEHDMKNRWKISGSLIRKGFDASGFPQYLNSYKHEPVEMWFCRRVTNIEQSIFHLIP